MGDRELASISAPTVVVVPTRDQLVPPRWQWELASLIPGSRIQQIEGARHEVPWTHSEQLANVLAKFLRELISPLMADRRLCGATQTGSLEK